jgi:hypothetical protein
VHGVGLFSYPYLLGDMTGPPGVRNSLPELGLGGRGRGGYSLGIVTCGLMHFRQVQWHYRETSINKTTFMEN